MERASPPLWSQFLGSQFLEAPWGRQAGHPSGPFDDGSSGTVLTFRLEAQRGFEKLLSVDSSHGRLVTDDFIVTMYKGFASLPGELYIQGV